MSTAVQSSYPFGDLRPPSQRSLSLKPGRGSAVWTTSAAEEKRQRKVLSREQQFKNELGLTTALPNHWKVLQNTLKRNREVSLPLYGAKRDAK